MASPSQGSTVPTAIVTGVPPAVGTFLTLQLLAPSQYANPSRTRMSSGSDDIPEASVVVAPPAFETLETLPAGKSVQKTSVASTARSVTPHPCASSVTFRPSSSQA